MTKAQIIWDLQTSSSTLKTTHEILSNTEQNYCMNKSVLRTYSDLFHEIRQRFLQSAKIMSQNDQVYRSLGNLKFTQRYPLEHIFDLRGKVLRTTHISMLPYD